MYCNAVRYFTCCSWYPISLLAATTSTYHKHALLVHSSCFCWDWTVSVHCVMRIAMPSAFPFVAFAQCPCTKVCGTVWMCTAAWPGNRWPQRHFDSHLLATLQGHWAQYYKCGLLMWNVQHAASACVDDFVFLHVFLFTWTFGSSSQQEYEWQCSQLMTESPTHSFLQQHLLCWTFPEMFPWATSRVHAVICS